MDTGSIKLKKCSVKLNRLQFIGVTPGEIQEQILDQRIRRCSVRVQRCNEAQLRIATNSSIANGTPNGHKMRRCCIRLPRLNVSRSDISSPAASVNVDLMSEEELEDFVEDSN